MERVLLTQQMLDEVVRRIVPKEYWPLDILGLKPPDLPRPAVVTNITVQVEEEFLGRVIKYRDVDELLASMPRAYTLNWGVLRKNARLPDWEDYTHSSSIWINETAYHGLKSNILNIWKIRRPYCLLLRPHFFF